jgi:hypothetical protein
MFITLRNATHEKEAQMSAVLEMDLVPAAKLVPQNTADTGVASPSM